MSRVWAITETGDIGSVSVSFDLTGYTPLAMSDVRLLIDRDGDGFADNDVAPISGTPSGNIITFTAVDFQDGDYLL